MTQSRTQRQVDEACPLTIPRRPRRESSPTLAIAASIAVVLMLVALGAALAQRGAL